MGKRAKHFFKKRHVKNRRQAVQNGKEIGLVNGRVNGFLRVPKIPKPPRPSAEVAVRVTGAGEIDWHNAPV